MRREGPDVSQELFLQETGIIAPQASEMFFPALLLIERDRKVPPRTAALLGMTSSKWRMFCLLIEFQKRTTMPVEIRKLFWLVPKNLVFT